MVETKIRNIPDDVYHKIRIQAAIEETSMQKLMLSFIVKGVKGVKLPKKKKAK